MLSYSDEEDEIALLAETAHRMAMKKGVQKRLRKIARGLQDVVKSARKAAKTVTRGNVFKMMEFFTCVAMLTTMALTTDGWTASEPVTIGTGFDLRTREGQLRALKLQDEYELEVATLEFPWTPWSIMQNMNMKIPGHQEKLKQQRIEDHPFLKFTRDVCREQQ